MQPKEETVHTWRWQVKDKDRRELPLVPEVTRLLLDLQVELPDGQPYLLPKPERYLHIVDLQRRGKLSDKIRRCPENNFTRDWQRIFRLAGIKDAEFHDLRRTCITEWLESPEFEARIKEYLGIPLPPPTPEETTTRTYPE